MSNSISMATSCNTHAYDGQLREKWFQMRPMLLEKYLPQCVSFDDTLKEIEQWLDRKYFNVKRIARARRSLRILATQRKGNFDSRNDIDVEELLPILWDKVRNQNDIHDTFYEQLCDITGGSCSQGRSTRLFQFLFLFDLPSDAPTTTPNADEQAKRTDESNDQESVNNDSVPTAEISKLSVEQTAEGEETKVDDTKPSSSPTDDNEESKPSAEQATQVDEKPSEVDDVEASPSSTDNKKE